MAVNEAICEARPIPPAAMSPRPGRPGKGGLTAALAAEIAAEVEHLAAQVARSLGGGAGLEAVELAIRTAMMRLGGRLLEDLLGLDAGHRGPRVDCGAGHQAEFVACRAKTIDTVLGPVQARRAWYHCTTCGHGLAPRDAELGPGGASTTARADCSGPGATRNRPTPAGNPTTPPSSAASGQSPNS